MGTFVRLTASDGHVLDGYRADPPGTARGGIVVVQEAFGVNDHIRSVCDSYAGEGYAALAPAIYDRQQHNAAFGYDTGSLDKARTLRAGLTWDETMLDIAAAASAVRAAGGVGIVGYCVGGSVAWLAACRLVIDAAACYYASDIAALRHESPRCPTIMHFAERDRFIPLSDVDNLRAERPDLPIHVYPGEHGFNCRHRPASYNPDSATLALDRTLALFAQHVG